MKISHFTIITAIMLCLIPKINFAQVQPPPPFLGSAESFAVFTAVGALTNDGATAVTGDVGSDVGGVDGFPPGVLIGSIHDADGTSASAAPDVCTAYGYLDGILGGTTIGTTLGSGQTLTPNVYILGAASTLNGSLILNAEDNPDAIFVFQIDGAFATSVGSSVVLMNGASYCNVYWQINGAVTLAEGSIFQGTILASGAIHVLEAAALSGRALTCAGAIDLHNNIITNGLPLASTITANGPTTFCAGGSVTLSGNMDGIWNTGEVSESIIVNTAGDFFVTNTDGCGVEISNSISVTVNTDVPPSITCPPDRTIECDESTLPANTGMATAPVSCNVTPVISFVDVVVPGVCPQESTITRTWTATYGLGNSVTCTQVIQVEDTTPPVITIVNPLLAAPGETTYVQCYGQDPQWAIPSFDSESVEAEDNCGGAVTVSFSQSLEREGNCEEDGYIILYRLTWTATDICGNSSSVFVFYALVDTIAPVIYGVPEDITVNCNDIPALPDLVYATDECLCACVVLVQESELPTGCLNGQVLLRTWIASDQCGNETVVTQRITLIDNQYPVISVIQPEIAGVPDGTILNYACSEGGMPDFLNALDEYSVVGSGACGGANSVSFSLTSIDADAFNCEIYGYLAQRTYQWTVVDACGRTTLLTIVARLIDDEAPVLVGVPTAMTCIDDPALANIYADDACGEAYTEFTEVEIPNPCGTGAVIKRTYEAFDNCGNTTSTSVILVTNNLAAPVLEFVDTTMNTRLEGEILTVNCAGSQGHYTAFRASDMRVTDSCSVGVVMSFTERLISTGDCTVGGIVSVIELKWTATDFCGNTSERIIIAQVVDHSSPVFVDFKPLLTIGCAEAMPIIRATDNCGEVVVTTQDSIVRGDCVFEYVIYREITATDPCGNATTRQQVIQVGDGSGPTIIGVVADICDDLTIPPVTAYDACAGEYVAVTMVQDTLDVICQDGMVIQRTWTAVNSCGYATVIHQHIIMDDQTPPEIYPLAPIINYIANVGHHRIFLSEQDLIDQLNLLGEHNVFAIDECDQQVTLQLKIRIRLGDCEEDGYSERRRYTWFATDQCGNTASYSVFVAIIDNVAPLIEQFIPADTTIVCAELPVAPVIQVDSPDNATVVYTEVIVPGGSPGEFIVTRTWVATDSCGNESVGVQQITWIPDTYLACEVLAPGSVTCNSHGVLIGSIVTGGFGEYTYDWEVVGEDCFIQGGQGTPELIIYVGWGELKVILTVTDAFGCESMCMVLLNCVLSPLQILTSPMATQEKTVDYLSPTFELNQDMDTGAYLSELNVWPSPTTGMVNLSFKSDLTHEVQFTVSNFLGQVVSKEQFTALSGLNTRQLDLGNFTPGPYLMHLQTGQEVQSKVVVVLPE